MAKFHYALLGLFGFFPNIALAQAIPPDVVAALAAVPGVDTITVGSGTTYQAPTVLKVKNLTITPGSKIEFSPQSLQTGMRYIIAVQNLYVQVPTPSETSGIVTYQRTPATKQWRRCQSGTNGGRGGIPDANGRPGGAGGDGMPAETRGPFKVYAIVNRIIVKGGNPTGARLLNLNFDGLDGDSGADGCRGGKGGDGTDRSGFQGAGDSGKPGPGGRGGAAAPGQDGADLFWFVSSAIADDVAFLIASVEGGQAGAPGQGGLCGEMGRAGSGNWTGHGGRGIDCDEPRQAASGSPAQRGQRGSITKAVGDYSSVFKFKRQALPHQK